jgi:Phytanoyl-CoA dioxygenase (PhyH)
MLSSVVQMSFVLDRRHPSPDGIVDPQQWLDQELPLLLDVHGDLASRAAARLELPPLVVEVDGERGGLHVEGGRLVAGVVDGALTASMSSAAFSDWVRELRTIRALQLTGEIERHGGSLERLEEWELVLHTLVHGTPVHEPGAVTFVDRDGAPLDLHQVFGPDDDPADIAHFLREAGYLHLRGWLDPADMAVIAEDIDRVLPSYEEGDGRSWWSTLDDGRRVCVRLLHFVEHSPTTARILSSPRWDQLRRALAGDEELVQAPVEGNCIEALAKPVGVATGISDVPWHRDCSLGGHPYKCGGTVVGISVTGGTEQTGLLRAVAGSHRAATLSEPTWRGNDLPVVALPTEAGDITVHISCTLHESLPPTERGRKVMYTGFGLPPLPEEDAERRQAMTDLRNQAHVLTSQPTNDRRVR